MSSLRVQPKRLAKDTAAIKQPATYEEEPEADSLIPYQPKAVAAVATHSLGPVFETFTTKVNLSEGLCIIRPLGGGKYEIVNLSTVDGAKFSSREIGKTIKGKEGCLEALDIGEHGWKVAKEKCGQAVKAATNQIFRFQELPLELRYRVYDFAIVASKPLSHLGNRAGLGVHLGYTLRATCKQIYHETAAFFWKNTFHYITDKDFTTRQNLILPHVINISYDWLAYANKDPLSFYTFDSCPNLKTLSLTLNRLCIEGTQYRGRRQWRHQNDTNIKKFNKSNGFDALVQIRGLDRVNIKIDLDHRPATLLDSEITAFEDFLNRILTQQKPEPKAVKKSKPEKGGKLKKRMSTRSIDSDAEDDDYKPTKRRVRRARLSLW